MRYISIDIETTGLDPERYNILSIGAIIEDTDTKLPFDTIPKFHVAIKHKEVIGSLYAMNMNRELIDAIARYQDAETQDEKNDLVHMTGMQFLNEEDVVEAFHDFLFLNKITDMTPEEILKSQMKTNYQGLLVPMMTSKMKPTSITVAGKNFSSFDKRFLERLPRWKQTIRVKQRVIDPAILFIDWKNDDCLPSLGECKKRAKIDGAVSHNALEDAWDVIQLLRKTY